ncbi:glycosyltransferase [hydrocarbon metagenome]|uniref:Glycosyltransferase n=1 Tax=hydrocarbon metagenome TaxID=938273 RepID=A0A0W8E2C9_9ZZZZ
MNTCLIVSTYPPRKCGIATFSEDLRDSLIHHVPEILVAAINEPFQSHNYPSEVAVKLQQENTADYIACATWANREPGLDMVIIQHEYGIFGGPDGEYIVDLATHLTKPYLLVTHTVLPHPSIKQKEILGKLAGLAAGVLCMTERSCRLLAEVYEVTPDKISVVPHGVPNFIKKSRLDLKDKYGLRDRSIITTFGLIGPGKGLELGIKALSRLVEEHPRLLYIIAGATHPVLLRNEGERYRDSVIKLVADLHLDDHVLFDNRFLDDDELGDYLYMTDIYLSPYPNLDQAVSGTLAFAVGCGRAIVSTPYEYAREILAQGRGMIAREPTPEALADHLDLILRNPDLQQELETKAAQLGHTLTWASVAELYRDIADKILNIKVRC